METKESQPAPEEPLSDDVVVDVDETTAAAEADVVEASETDGESSPSDLWRRFSRNTSLKGKN